MDPTSLDSSTRLRKAEGLAASELDGEAVLLSLSDGHYYHFNRVGTRIWALLDDTPTLGGVVEALLERYDIDRETCERDVRAVLEEMHERALIELV